MELLNNWADGSANGVFNEFLDYNQRVDDPSKLPQFEGVEILLASYGTPSYEGYAFVLFRKDGKLFEVNGSHCSCYGLEDQWEPEETSVEELLHRLDKGDLGAGSYDDNPFAAELRQVLDALSAERTPQPADGQAVER